MVNGPPCAAYYHTVHAVGPGGNDGGMLLRLSEDLYHAYGLVALQGTGLGVTVQESANSWSSGFGDTTRCFTDEGKTIWEIYDIRGVAPSVVAVNLGPEVSPLERLRADGER